MKIDFLSMLKKHSSLILVSFIFGSRFLTFIAFPIPSTQPDSSSYSTGSFLDFSLVSFTGDSVRGWPTPLLFALSPSDAMAMFFLLTISAISWVFLGKTLLKSLEKPLSQALFVVVFLVVSCSPQLIQWETVLLAQSLMISTTVLLSTLVFKTIQNPDLIKYPLIGIVLSTFLVIQKSSNLPLAIIFIGIFLFCMLKKNEFFKFSMVLALSFVLIGYGILVGNNVNNNWAGTTYSGKTIFWHLGGQSPAAQEFVKFLDLSTNAPKCLFAGAPFQNLDEGISSVLENCPEVNDYLRGNVEGDLAKFLFLNPSATLKMISIGVGAVSTDSASHYGRAISIFPSGMNSLLFGSISPDTRFSQAQDQVQAFKLIRDGEPIWLFVPSLFIVLVSFLLLTLRIIRGRPQRLDLLLLILQIGFIIQIGTTFLMIPSEWVRSSSPFTFSLLTLSLFVVARILEGNKLQKNYS